MNTEKKKINEVKIDIKNNTFVKGKVFTKVFKFQSISEVNNLIESTESDVRLKLLINYASNKFYVFETLNSKKIVSSVEFQELKSKELASLLKSFYCEEKLEWNDTLLKKKKLMKNALAPVNFEVKDNYLISDNRYINLISIEHIGGNLSFKDILKNQDCWLSIDLYKINNKYILNKLDEMQDNGVIQKKFTYFISNKIDTIVGKLKKEIIFQCEFKLLLYGSSLNYANEQSEAIKKIMTNNYCSSYIPQEASNTRKLFEKCIYPNLKMDIIHSLSQQKLFEVIGGMANV